MKEKQSLEQGAMQPSFKSVTGKGGIKVIDGSSVKFGRFDGAEPHCVGLTDSATGDDGSSMACWFYAVGERILPVDPELRRNRHGAGRSCMFATKAKPTIAKAGDVMFIPKADI